MNIRTTVRLPATLLHKAKKKAAAEGRTLTSLIEEGLIKVTNDAPKAAEKPRRVVSLPVSGTKGGFRPGMENLTYSQIVEIEDQEYLEQLAKGFK